MRRIKNFFTTTKKKTFSFWNAPRNGNLIMKINIKMIFDIDNMLL